MAAGKKNYYAFSLGHKGSGAVGCCPTDSLVLQKIKHLSTTLFTRHPHFPFGSTPWLLITIVTRSRYPQLIWCAICWPVNKLRIAKIKWNSPLLFVRCYRWELFQQIKWLGYLSQPKTVLISSEHQKLIEYLRNNFPHILLHLGFLHYKPGPKLYLNAVLICSVRAASALICLCEQLQLALCLPVLPSTDLDTKFLVSTYLTLRLLGF